MYLLQSVIIGVVVAHNEYTLDAHDARGYRGCRGYVVLTEME